MIPYAHQTIEDDDIAAVVNVLRSDWLTQGPTVRRFEEAVAEFVGAKYSVAVSNGTAAIYCAVWAAKTCQDADILTTPLTFVATANAIKNAIAGDNQASVRFGDVEYTTGNLRLTDWSRFDLVVPVHYAGLPVNPPLDHKWIIEDACHAFGAFNYTGTRVGSCRRSLACCFSFHPVKPITTGEGGMITTNDESFAEECRSIRDHGRREGKCVFPGWNFRMSDIQAALGLSQLKKCDRLINMRAELAAVYHEKLPLWIERPAWQTLGSWHLYAARVPAETRDALRRHLAAEGIGTQVHYALVTDQPYWRMVETGTPNARDWADREISLPLYAGLTVEEVERVCSTIARFK